MDYAGGRSILKIAEVAEILRLSRSQVYRLIQQKSLRGVMWSEKSVRVMAADLNSFIERQCGVSAETELTRGVVSVDSGRGQ